MINKTDIRRMAGTASYSRGEDLYLSNKVYNFSVDMDEEDDDVDYISADVKGSGRKRYEVIIRYDRELDEMMDAYCSCPAFFSYSGICKHCVAVALKYQDYQKVTCEGNKKKSTSQELVKLMRAMGLSQEGIEEVMETGSSWLEAALGDRSSAAGNTSERNTASEAGKHGRSSRGDSQAMRTTPSIQRLLATQVNRRISQIQSDVREQVSLDPYLNCENEKIHLEFKIGIKQKYVLKDVFALVRRIREQEEYAYGQKLKFLHTMDAFTPESRRLVKFLEDWTDQNRKHFMQVSYYGYQYGGMLQELRSMPLTEADLEDFLDAVGEREFTANVFGTGESRWHVTQERLPRTMEITGKKDGIEVSVNHLTGYVGNRFYIYFLNQLIYRVPREELTPISGFLNCMADIPDRKINIAKADVPLFCRELLPLLEQHYECTKTDFDETAYGVLPVSFEIYLDAPQKQFVTCKVLAVYGDQKYNVFANEDTGTSRDIIKETETGKIVSSYCNAYDDKEKMMVLAEDEDRLYDLLVYGIPKFQELGEVFVSDAIRRIRVTSAPKVSVGLSVNGDWLELQMTSEDMSREELVEILSRYNRKKKFYRLKNGDFVNMEDEGMTALLELQKGLNLTASQMKQEKVEVPKYRAMYLDGELSKSQALPVNRNRAFRSLVRNMKTVEDNDFEIPTDLEPVLREYQKRGFLWIKTLCHNGFGGILADDMGLGKTLQVIAFLASELQEENGVTEAAGDTVADGRDGTASAQPKLRRSIIVCPASLVFNWHSEFEKFAPQLSVRMVTGTAAERREILKQAGEQDILLTSYDLLKRDLKHYEGMKFFCEIIDEAQYIKNHNTQAAQAVRQINAGFRLALTGTPIENRLSELWSIFDYLMPGFLYGYQRFRDEIETPVLQHQDEAAMQRLQKMIRPFVLRRLKKEVLTDLPDKLEECIYAKMEGEQQSLYDAHVKRLQLLLDKNSEEEFKRSKLQILSELTKLRQICCDPALLFENYKGNSSKSEVCIDLIKNAVSGGHKILLFSQFTSMLERLQQRLSEEKISYYVLTGATSREKRRALVEAFQQDETQVFCISLKAGGTGLNLTAADIVIHYDPWWNLAVQNQATDRAHRIGQENVVNVYKLITKGTIEENIAKLQEKKHELADQVLGAGGMDGGSFTKEELLELLK